MNTISSLTKNRNNNLDIIRLMASILVVLSHSFSLSIANVNDTDPEPLKQLTGELTIGKLAVIVFFIISGHLITQSYDRTQKPIYFLKCRILRIYPGLIFVVTLSMLILGPILSTLPIREYVGSNITWSYLKNITLIDMTYNLPGVFTHNAYPNAVNGSLWTLIYEFKCYLIVLVLGMTKLLRKGIVLFIFLLTSFLYIIGLGGLDIELLSYFSAGMVCYTYRDRINLNKAVALYASLVTVLCLLFYSKYLTPLIVVCITYSMTNLAYNTRAKINLSKKFGDLSYGTYIFAFPIQQTVTYCFGGQMEWWMNFMISMPFILLMAAISWHLVEKNALKLKNLSFANIIHRNRIRVQEGTNAQ